ncbi:MAG: winged helix-turn-helix transcriptional regulator [Candidatus Heimdallarchaeota archaeon]
MARHNSTSFTKPDPSEPQATAVSPEEASDKESCEITEIIAILSRKWTLNVLRELGLHDTLRFNEILTNCGNISPRTLSKRLKELAQHGLIHRTQFNEIPPKVVYSLTLKGVELVHSFKDLDNWAKKWNLNPS